MSTYGEAPYVDAGRRGMSSLTAEETAAMFADLGVSGTGYMPTDDPDASQPGDWPTEVPRQGEQSSAATKQPKKENKKKKKKMTEAATTTAAPSNLGWDTEPLDLQATGTDDYSCDQAYQRTVSVDPSDPRFNEGVQAFGGGTDSGQPEPGHQAETSFGAFTAASPQSPESAVGGESIDTPGPRRKHGSDTRHRRHDHDSNESGPTRTHRKPRHEETDRTKHGSRSHNQGQEHKRHHRRRQSETGGGPSSRGVSARKRPSEDQSSGLGSSIGRLLFGVKDPDGYGRHSKERYDRLFSSQGGNATGSAGGYGDVKRHDWRWAAHDEGFGYEERRRRKKSQDQDQ